jgi:PKD repeat protein
VYFSSLGSVEPDGDPLFYGWTFGDNTSASTASAVHTYATAGSYTVRLTLDDGRGGTDTDSLVITVVPSTGFPATAVLDNFNRPDGPLGGQWVGDTEGVVISGGAFAPAASGYETPVFQTFFGPTQEAHVRILGLTVGAPQQGLVLKAQSTHAEAAKIEIRYEQILNDVVVSTHIPGEGWQEQGVLPLPLAPFDVLGARAHPDGSVDVYRNGILAGTISVATWPFAGQGGYIGLQVVGGLATRFDDFGGGSLGIVDVTAEPALALPQMLALSRAFPNPSRSAVSFSLELPRAGTVSWTIHDLQGRALWREHRAMEPGRWTITWPGRVEDGALAPPGLYFADVTIDGTRFSRRLVLTR